MFFMQQANSLKNSSQIGQRKDINSKNLANNFKQSRGDYRGDITSQSGLTSATTANGNQDGNSHENRSGHSGNEKSPNGAGTKNPTIFSMSGNGGLNKD